MFISEKKLEIIKKMNVHNFLKSLIFLKDNEKLFHTPKKPFCSSTYYQQPFNIRL